MSSAPRVQYSGLPLNQYNQSGYSQNISSAQKSLAQRMAERMAERVAEQKTGAAQQQSLGASKASSFSSEPKKPNRIVLSCYDPRDVPYGEFVAIYGLIVVTLVGICAMLALHGNAKMKTLFYTVGGFTLVSTIALLILLAINGSEMRKRKLEREEAYQNPLPKFIDHK